MVREFQGPQSEALIQRQQTGWFAFLPFTNLSPAEQLAVQALVLIVCELLASMSLRIRKNTPVNRMVASVARKHHNYPNRKHESVYECTGMPMGYKCKSSKKQLVVPPPLTCQRLLHYRQWSLYWRTCANACTAESLKEGPTERWRLKKEKWWPTKQNKVHDALGRFVKLKRTRSKGERASTGRYQCLQMAILHYSCLIGSGRALAPILLALGTSVW